jgi:uncharacterized protein YndB with AHSA1/START domain
MKKIELEFPIHASPSFIYQYVSTPDSLGEWFADNVNSRGQNFTFIWDDSEEVAKRVAQRTDQFVRFKWVDADDEDAFFEFRIQVDALTKDVSLIITDFADDDEEEELKMFWENKISDLKHAIGG